MTIPHVPAYVKGEILYSNLFFDNLTSLAYTGTVVDGFEPTNGVDWRDFSIFSASAGAVLSVTITGGAADSLVLWPVAGAAGTVTLKNNAGTVISTATVSGAGVMVWNTFTATLPAGTVSLTFSAAMEFRLLAVGLKLTLPCGQWADMSSPASTCGLIADNLISVNGSILARNIRRTEKNASIQQDNLTQTFVRNTWEPFARHASRYAFFYRWNPVTYPSEIVFAVASDIVAPVNTKAQLMRAEMPIKFITAAYP